MDLGVMKNSHQDITSPIVCSAVKKWLERNQKSRFFMFVHFFDVHFDFIPPPPYDTMFDKTYTGQVTGKNFFFDKNINAEMPKSDLDHLIALYDGEIAWTDSHLGKLIADLEKAGQLDNTVVAVTSDHGTEFFEHGRKAHRMTLFDEVIRIPLVIRYPTGLKPGVRVKAQTRIIDVGPTLMDLAGLNPPQGVLGHSLSSLAQNKPLDFDNTAISELFSMGNRMRTVRTLEWKFFDFLKTNKRCYVDLGQDPMEWMPKENLSGSQGKKLNKLYKKIVTDLAKSCGKGPEGADRSTIPEDVLKQLKSLGYVGD